MSSDSYSYSGVHGRFISTSAKDFVRDEIDRPIIANFKAKYFPEQALAYLGLPGAALLDVLSWREFIGSWTSVQIAKTAEDAETADELERNVLRNHLERDAQLLRADIDELLSTSSGQDKLHWAYQIVNLDYYGGLVGNGRRLDALRGLFVRQQADPFVLFITLNLRDDDRNEMAGMVAEIEEELLELDYRSVEECFAKHRELERVWKRGRLEA